MLIDTPGIRGLALWDAEAGVERAFADVRELAPGLPLPRLPPRGRAGLRRRGRHRRGELDAERLDDHRRMERELVALDIRRDPRLASERRKQWRAVSRAQRSHDRMKGKPG